MTNARMTLGAYLLPVKSLAPDSIYADSDFVYVDIASIDREINQITAPQLLRAEDAPSRARQLVQTADVIVSTVRPNLNTVAVIDESNNGAIASTGFCVLRANQDLLDPRYLFHWISSKKTVDSLVKVATGASYPAVSDKVIKSLIFTPPALNEQKRIAAILDKAESLRRKRQQAIQLADDFLHAVFIDMFGDPVTNPKGWPVYKLGVLGDLQRGKSRHRPRDDARLYGGSHPFIQTGDVANCKGMIEQFHQTYSDLGLQQSKLWPAGTLCITIAANIGKTGVLSFDACFPDSIVGFTPSADVTPEYIQFWLNEIQAELERVAPQAAQKNINLEILRDLDVPLPDMASQQDFVAVVTKTRALQKKNDAVAVSEKYLMNALQNNLINSHA